MTTFVEELLYLTPCDILSELHNQEILREYSPRFKFLRYFYIHFVIHDRRGHFAL
jgi:hypothetical protein